MPETTNKPTPINQAKTQDNGLVTFISAKDEPYGFKVMGLTALRYPKEPSRLMWRVPKADVERFKRHHFCKRGRVVQE